MLLRVDVSTSSSGALLVTLSDHASGFAPYRLDNCTSLTLHLRYHCVLKGQLSFWMPSIEKIFARKQ